eukprot:11220902-Lingulodinium_polyedra.AAC.1
MSAAFRRPKQDRARPHYCRACGSTQHLVVCRSPSRNADGVAWRRRCRPLSRERFLAAARRPEDSDLAPALPEPPVR